jgi:hypothetical protein
MDYKVNKLLELLNLIEDDKTRMGTFIDPEVIKKSKLTDDERKAYYKKASEAEDELHKLYFSNMAVGYESSKAMSLAKDTLKKEWGRHSSEHDAYKAGEEGGSSGFERVAGEDDSVSPDRKEAVTNLIKGAKDHFKGNDDALKILAAHLVHFGFDEIVPSSGIPHYGEISKLLKRLEDEGKGKRKSTLLAAIEDQPPDGLGISRRQYYNVMNYLKDNAKSLQHESFVTGLTSLFGGGKGPAEFKLSNLEPMIDVINRDMQNYNFKNFGIHLQGVSTESGEDMLKDIPSVKHEYQGDVLLMPIDPKMNLKKTLKKAQPGKKVILFGFNSKAAPVRKGWEGFPYKLVTNPIVIGSYSLSPESKSESLLIMLEGFQCQHYVHATLSCGLNKGRPCGWKGFPSVNPDDMQKECTDFR